MLCRHDRIRLRASKPRQESLRDRTMFPSAHILPNPPRRDPFGSRPQPVVRTDGRSGDVRSR